MQNSVPKKPDTNFGIWAMKLILKDDDKEIS
jgi:hypothetical protein